MHASNLSLPPTTQDLHTHPSALMMVIVLVVLVVPAPSLVRTGCSAGWGGMSPGPARRLPPLWPPHCGTRNSGAAARARGGRPKATSTGYSRYFGAAERRRGADQGQHSADSGASARPRPLGGPNLLG